MEAKTVSGMLLTLLVIGTLAFSVHPVRAFLITDINNDGIVDGKDITLVAMAFGSYEGPPPHPRWDARCDINGDHIIDGKDLWAVMRDFGK